MFDIERRLKHCCSAKDIKQKVIPRMLNVECISGQSTFTFDFNRCTEHTYATNVRISKIQAACPSSVQFKSQIV